MDTVHKTEDSSLFCNVNIDPDYNCLNSYTANSSYYTLLQLSIMYINPKICLSFMLTAEA